MENPELNPVLDELRENLQHRAIVASPATPPAGHCPRVLDHDFLQVRRGDPDALLGAEDRLHDFVVVVAVGEDLQRDGTTHGRRIREAKLAAEKAA